MTTYCSTRRVDALQWDGENTDAIVAFCDTCAFGFSMEHAFIPVEVGRHAITDSGRLLMWLKSASSGALPAFTMAKGDWVLRGQYRLIDFAKDDVFAQEWEAAE